MHFIDLQVGMDFLGVCTCGTQIQTKDHRIVDAWIVDHEAITGHRWLSEMEFYNLYGNEMP